MVVVAAVLVVKEGQTDIFKKACKKMVASVLKEPGAKAYTIHQAIDNPNKFLIYEQYDNMDVLKAHGETDHFKAFIKATQDIVVSGETTIYNLIA